MQRLEVSGAVRHTYIYIYMSLGVKGFRHFWTKCTKTGPNHAQSTNNANTAYTKHKDYGPLGQDAVFNDMFQGSLLPPSSRQ
jgi:hypothetical protein